MLKKNKLTTKLGVSAFALAFVASFAGAAAAADFPARIGHIENPDQPRHMALEKVAAMVAERTNGAVEFQIFPSSQLGKQRELNEGVQLGSLEGAVSATSWMAGFNPLVSITDIPFYLPEDPADAQALREGPFGKALLATFEPKGFHAVALWPFGKKDMTSNKPLEKLADIKGQKFRVIDSQILMAQYQALGASAIALPFGELYTALQNGVVDGQENPLSSNISMRFYEVQDYMLLSGHGAIEDVIVFNPNWWNSLPAEYQGIITDAFQEVVPELDELYRSKRAAWLKTVEESGSKVTEMSDAEKSEMREVTYGPTSAAYLNNAGEEGRTLIDLYQKEYNALTNGS